MLHVEARTRLSEFALDVALDARPGQCLALAGPSGAGKSTVLRIVAGLLRPDHGRVSCGGETWLDRERGIDLPPEQRGCGFVFQDYALFEHLSAWQNVAYGMRHLPRRERRRQARSLLERFGLADRATARPRTLSGGERQRRGRPGAGAPSARAAARRATVGARRAHPRERRPRELAGVLRRRRAGRARDA